MNLRKRLNKLKIMVAGVAVLSTLSINNPVFADSEYNGRLIVPRVDNISEFFINRVDITNNQLEFKLFINDAQEKTILRIGAGWVSDRSEPILNADVRTYNLGDPGLTTIFWNGDEDIENYRSSEEGASFKTYTVDAFYDLRHNIFKDMFYIVEFTDGDVWMNKMSYVECGESWTMGKSCNQAYFISDKEVDNAAYELEDAPTEKFMKRESMVTDETLTVSDSESEAQDMVTDEPEPEEQGVVNNETEPETESGDTESPALITKVASVVKYSTDVSSSDYEEGASDDDIEESSEGFGDTTLDVPMLGKNVEMTKCSEFNFWPYLLIGFGGGILLSLVLSLIKKANKALSTS